MQKTFVDPAKWQSFQSISLHDFPIQTPFYEPPDVGGAGAGGSGVSSPSDDPAGNGAADAGGFELNDDAMVVVERGKPPVRWGDHRNSAYMPKSKYDEGAAFLLKIAEGFDRAGKTQARPQAQPQRQPQQPTVDPLEVLERETVVSGRDVAKIVRQLQQQGFGPMAGLIAQQQQTIKALQDRFENTDRQTQEFATERSTQMFESHLGSTIKALPEIKGVGQIPDTPEVRELLQDLWLSHKQDGPEGAELRRDFGKMAQTRIESLFKLFTQLQAGQVKKAKEARQTFFSPTRGRAAGNGKGGYVHKTGDALADEFFGSMEQNT